MAQIPDMTFKVKMSGSGGTERLDSAIREAKQTLGQLQDAMYKVQAAMNDLEFVVERVKPEESIPPDEG
jgi:Sec-independent protein translocase protein TatA